MRLSLKLEFVADELDEVPEDDDEEEDEEDELELDELLSVFAPITTSSSQPWAPERERATQPSNRQSVGKRKFVNLDIAEKFSYVPIFGMVWLTTKRVNYNI